MNEPKEKKNELEQSHRLDAPIRMISKVVTFGAFLTGITAFSYAFFFRSVAAFRLPLLIVFFTTAVLGCVWALLIAARELSIGVRTKITGSGVWMTIFWGSFGIVGLVVLTIMVSVVLR